MAKETRPHRSNSPTPIQLRPPYPLPPPKLAQNKNTRTRAHTHTHTQSYPPPHLSITPPGGEGVTWPMNNKKSVGNQAPKAPKFLFTLVILELLLCGVRPPPPRGWGEPSFGDSSPRGGGEPSSLVGDGHGGRGTKKNKPFRSPTPLPVLNRDVCLQEAKSQVPAPEVMMPAGGAVPKSRHHHGGIMRVLPTSRNFLNPPPSHSTHWVDNQPTYPRVEDSLLKRRTSTYQPAYSLSFYRTPPTTHPTATFV